MILSIFANGNDSALTYQPRYLELCWQTRSYECCNDCKCNPFENCPTIKPTKKFIEIPEIIR